MDRYDSTDSEDLSDTNSDYEICTRESGCGLQFDAGNIENLILKLSDAFDFRVIMSGEKAKAALMVTSGLAVAGGLIGKHFGGHLGAAVGSVVGGACGVGIVVVSMRDIWNDVKNKMFELYEIVYDYLAGLGIEDYKRAAMFITQGSADSRQLVMIVVQVISDLLGKRVMSSITGA